MINLFYLKSKSKPHIKPQDRFCFTFYILKCGLAGFEKKERKEKKRERKERKEKKARRGKKREEPNRNSERKNQITKKTHTHIQKAKLQLHFFYFLF
jgi:hypothetical protein